MSLTDPVLAAIGAVTPQLVVYDARVPRNDDGTPLALAYVVVYPDLGVLSAPALCGTLTQKDVTFRLVYVNTTRSGVEKMCDAVRAVILGRTFTDSGWSAEFDPDDFQNTTPVSPDVDIPSRVVMYATDEFRALASRV